MLAVGYPVANFARERATRENPFEVVSQPLAAFCNRLDHSIARENLLKNEAGRFEACVKNLTPMERCGLVMGAVLFVTGLVMVIWPRPGVVLHFTNGAQGMQQGTDVQAVTKTGARVYGIMTLLLGTGIASASVYRGRTQHSKPEH
jgi:hypothetical protein